MRLRRRALRLLLPLLLLLLLPLLLVLFLLLSLLLLLLHLLLLTLLLLALVLLLPLLLLCLLLALLILLPLPLLLLLHLLLMHLLLLEVRTRLLHGWRRCLLLGLYPRALRRIGRTNRLRHSRRLLPRLRSSWSPGGSLYRWLVGLSCTTSASEGPPILMAAISSRLRPNSGSPWRRLRTSLHNRRVRRRRTGPRLIRRYDPAPTVVVAVDISVYGPPIRQALTGRRRCIYVTARLTRAPILLLLALWLTGPSL